MRFCKTEPTQPFCKPVSVRIVPENSAPIDARADGVIQGTWHIYSGLTWYKFFNTNKNAEFQPHPLFLQGIGKLVDKNYYILYFVNQKGPTNNVLLVLQGGGTLWMVSEQD